MSKIKMTRQEWETILNEITEIVVNHVDFLINGEGLKSDALLEELENTRMYYEPENIELVDERSDKEISDEEYYEYLGLRFVQGLEEGIKTYKELADKETLMKPNYTYEDYQNAFEYFVAGRVFTKEMFEMGAIWKDLLDRRKPTKPNYINDNEFCSKCDFKVTVMGLWDMNYCSNCGQRIDWSDQHE